MLTAPLVEGLSIWRSSAAVERPPAASGRVSFAPLGHGATAAPSPGDIGCSWQAWDINRVSAANTAQSA
jgi:hypothetical protein